MTFPLAVAASVRSPGLALSVNLTASAASPGSAGLRGCIMASKGTGLGTITADTELVQGLAGPDDASTRLGAGTPGHLCAKALFAEYPLAQIDLVAPTEPAGNAATATVTFDDTTPVSSAQTVTLCALGREIQIVWQAAELDTAAATKLVAAVNAQTSDLPITAANGGGTLAVVTLTFKQKGTIGNDGLLYLTVVDGVGGSVVLSGNMGSGTAGTTECVLTTALTTISGREYDFIIPCLSNTDVALASATSGPGRVKTHMRALDQGFSAKLQQAIFGHTGALSGAKTGAAQHDAGEMQYIFFKSGQSLGCEFAGAEAGSRIRERLIDSASNRINTVYRATLYGARDLVANSLTEAEVEDALQSGVTPGTYTFVGEPRVSRPITTYFLDASGNPDNRILDVSRVDGVYDISKDLRSALPAQFPNCKLSADLTSGDDELPEGVVEVRDIKAFTISRLRFWQKRGVCRKDKLDAAIADGTLIVRVNPADDAQCDLVIPLSIVPPLAKFSLAIQKVQ